MASKSDLACCLFPGWDGEQLFQQQMLPKHQHLHVPLLCSNGVTLPCRSPSNFPHHPSLSWPNRFSSWLSVSREFSCAVERGACECQAALPVSAINLPGCLCWAKRAGLCELKFPLTPSATPRAWHPEKAQPKREVRAYCTILIFFNCRRYYWWFFPPVFSFCSLGFNTIFSLCLLA